MNHDPCKLYEELSNNQPVKVDYDGQSYQFQFFGRKIGFENYLLVTDCRGQTKKFGWGHGTAQVGQALHHLSKGWDAPQVPVYRSYDEAAETD